jgi:hypothetical protein
VIRGLKEGGGRSAHCLKTVEWAVHARKCTGRALSEGLVAGTGVLAAHNDCYRFVRLPNPPAYVMGLQSPHKLPCAASQDKLRLDLDEEGAVQWMTGLLMESATALMPQIVETTHRWATYWR